MAVSNNASSKALARVYGYIRFEQDPTSLDDKNDNDSDDGIDTTTIPISSYYEAEDDESISIASEDLFNISDDGEKEKEDEEDEEEGTEEEEGKGKENGRVVENVSTKDTTTTTTAISKDRVSDNTIQIDNTKIGVPVNIDVAKGTKLATGTVTRGGGKNNKNNESPSHSGNEGGGGKDTGNESRIGNSDIILSEQNNSKNRLYVDIHSKLFNNAATKIQAKFRGFRVFRKVRNQLYDQLMSSIKSKVKNNHASFKKGKGENKYGYLNPARPIGPIKVSSKEYSSKSSGFLSPHAEAPHALKSSKKPKSSPRKVQPRLPAISSHNGFASSVNLGLSVQSDHRVLGHVDGNWGDSGFSGSQSDSSEKKGYLPKVRDLLISCGHQEITALEIGRYPMYSALPKILNVIASGQLLNNKFIKKDHDDLFHLFLVVTLANDKKLIIEKSSDEILIREGTPQRSEGIQYKHVDVVSSSFITLNDMLDRAEAKIGSGRFFSYSEKNNNSQDFIMALFESSRLGSEQDRTFIRYEVKKLLKELPESRKLAGTMTEKTFNGRLEFLFNSAALSLDKNSKLNAVPFQDFVKVKVKSKEKKKDVFTFSDLVSEEVKKNDGLLNSNKEEVLRLVKTAKEEDLTIYFIVRTTLNAIRTSSSCADGVTSGNENE